jgi:hypothetical protein
MRGRQPKTALVLVAGLATILMILGGCVIRRVGPTQPTYVTQPAPQPVVVTQPAPQPVVVTAPAPAPEIANGAIAYPYQRVRFPLTIAYPRFVNIYVEGYGLDPTVSVYDAYGSRLGFNDDGGSSLDSQLGLSLAPGSYVVEVAGYSSSTGPFRLSIQ